MTRKQISKPVFVTAQIALMAALCFIGFYFFYIPLFTVGGGSAVALHLGNVFCVLAALLLGGWQGGLAGSIGMGIADLLNPLYITAAPKTFILKFLIGVICGFFAHKVFKISQPDADGKLKPIRKIAPGVIVSSFAGLLFNIIAEPVVSYFYALLLGNAAEFAMDYAILQLVATAINAAVAVIVASLLYFALRPALFKAGIFKTM